MKPGQANKDEILLILRGFVPADMIAVEHRFHPVRMWRFDYAIPSRKVAIDYQGHAGFVMKRSDGTPIPSGHSTIKGLTNDCEKSNEAQLAGWIFITFTALHFKEKDRKKHGLRPPYDILKQAFEAAKIRHSESQPTLF